MRQHIRQVIEAKIAADNKNFHLLDGVHPNDLGFQRMADRLAPTAANILHLLPPASVVDRAITVNLPAAVRGKCEELIEFIWGSAGFPKPQLPAKITKDAPSPIANLRHAKAVETLTIRMDEAQENTTHHLLHHGHACTFDDAANPKSYGMAEAVDKFHPPSTSNSTAPASSIPPSPPPAKN